MPLADLVSTTSNLCMGHSGPGVVALQIALKKLGYALSGTGYFGGGTDVAVQAFQKLNGLTADGVVGPATARAIDAAIKTLGTNAAPPPALQAEIGRPLWLEAGIKLIGTKEAPGAADNRVIIDWAKDEGGEIAKDYTHDAVPWCGLFANHCLSSCGIKGTGSLWALDFAGNWPSIKLIGPAVGAFAPMKRTGGGHIIMIVGRDQHGNIMGLGGNQSDAVNIEPFPLARLNQGFWWPKSVPIPKQIGFSSLPVVASNGRVSTKES
jgi:uncharacterized protein (TIGR02594 family)